MSYKSNYILPEPGLILLPSLAAKIGDFPAAHPLLDHA